MKIEKSYKRGVGYGKGFVMSGRRPDNDRWFERWFETIEKAQAYADKRGWKTTTTHVEVVTEGKATHLGGNVYSKDNEDGSIDIFF